jgi:T5SS/PEP-CTERM-associated repeat protein
MSLALTKNTEEKHVAKHRARSSRSTNFRRLAVASAATLLLGSGSQVLAQSFTQSGANSTSPNNLLPFAGTPSSLDFGDDIVYIGNGALGSFSALAGALFNAGALSIANGGTVGSIGTATFDGSGTKVELGANVNRLEVGNWGTGTLTVSGGALLDAAVNPGSCSSCFNVIGNGAGSTGTLTITGAGSEVRTLRSFTVGQSAVFTVADSGFDFGTPGGTTNAFVNVLAGGKLDTQLGTVGSNNRSPDGNGSEKANGTVVVDGSGSQWTVRPNTINGQVAFMNIGVGVDGAGKVTVRNGGKLLVDNTGGPAGLGPGVNIGVNGGAGELTITGAGTTFDMTGFSSAIQAGASGVTGNGSFSVLAGAKATATFLNVGRNGSTGTVLLDGAGSELTLSGLGNYASGGIGPASGTVGWVGTGKVTVSNGALWQINDGGADTSANGGRGPGLTIGVVGGTGTVEIKGSGAVVSLSSTSLLPISGDPDNANPRVNLGSDTGSTGTLDINGGGKLLMHGEAVSTPTFERTTYMGIGGTGDTSAGGTGTVNVRGAGSEIRITGTDAYATVGRGNNGNGTLNLSDGALFEATSINVGRGVGSNGTMTMDAATVQLGGQFTNAVGAGASFSIGNRGGSGSLWMSNGSTATVTNPGTAGASFNIGGTSSNPLGSGTVTMSGASQITVAAAAGLASASVGRDGTGILTLQGNSQIDIGDGTFHVGRLPTGFGSVTLEGASKILAGSVNIGGSSDTDAGGTGGIVVAGAGSELAAWGPSGFIGVGRRGTGTLAVENQGKVAAITMSVGRSAGGSGVLSVDNATIELSGQQTSGNMVGASLAVGIGGGSGVASVANGSVVNVTNLGSAGAAVTIGGSSLLQQGAGTLALTGGSQLNVSAASAELANVSIGRNGSGTAVLDASSINVGSGSVFVGRDAGSVGTLVMTNGSTLNAGYVGIGTTQPYDGNAYNGGTGIVVLNDSTINTGVFELGSSGILTGNNGTVDAVGDVIIGGTISPGQSPGRIRIRCNLIMLPGSRIVLEISGSGGELGDYQIDQLIIDDDASFDLASAEIVFSFLGETNPNEVSAIGGLNLDYYLRTLASSGSIDGPTQSLATTFEPGQTWSDVVNTANVSATSTSWDVTEFQYNGDGTFALTANPVPEPGTWGLMFAGLAAVGAFARRRQAQPTQA